MPFGSCSSPSRNARSPAGGKSGPAAALDIDPGKQREPDREIEPGSQDAEAMVAGKHPRYHAIGERTEDRGRLHGEAPQAEELRQPLGRREVADDRPPG